MTFDDKVRLLSELYHAFNRREIDRVLSALSPTVRWPNVLEKRELRGHAAVRAYWLAQFETIEPRVEPVEAEPPGADSCKVVKLANWAEGGSTLTPHEPQETDVVIKLDAKP